MGHSSRSVPHRQLVRHARGAASYRGWAFESIDQTRDNQRQEALLERLFKDVAALEVARKTAGDHAVPDRNTRLDNLRDIPVQNRNAQRGSGVRTELPVVSKRPPDKRNADDETAQTHQDDEPFDPMLQADLLKGWWMLPAVFLGSVVWVILIFVTVLWVL